MNPTFNPLDHPDAEIPRAYFCRLTGPLENHCLSPRATRPELAQTDRPRRPCLLQGGGLQAIPGGGAGGWRSGPFAVALAVTWWHVEVIRELRLSGAHVMHPTCACGAPTCASHAPLLRTWCTRS